MLDRADDLVISAGFDIYPTERENVITAHPGVAEVAVFGIPDERWGEQVALVCVKPEASPTEKELRANRCPRRRSARSSAKNVASRSGSVGTVDRGQLMMRGTLARTSQEVRLIHLLRRVL
jgi:acyl-CoA synthetase (AMP-forming)/AMP-acid ligase II